MIFCRWFSARKCCGKFKWQYLTLYKTRRIFNNVAFGKKTIHIQWKSLWDEDKTVGRLTDFSVRKNNIFYFRWSHLEKISPERMRSSRVAGKPQLIRSDMLLPVKSQNTTLFAVTWVDVVADDDNDDDDGDNAKRTHSSTTTRIEFDPLDVLSREHGFLYYATHTSWTTQSGITTLLRLSFAFGNSYIRTCRRRARTHCLTNKVTHT